MHENKLSLGLWSLIALGMSSIIGSGWLFSAYKSAKYAAGGAMLVWLAGGIIILFLALVIAEIATFYHKRGLFGRVLAISHNKDMGYIPAMANWFGIVATIPTEAMATVQYLAKAQPAWNHYFYINNSLTSTGLIIVTGLVFVYYLINFWGAKYLARSNNAITLFKVLIPVITALAILFAAFHPGNFVAEKNEFLPFGTTSIFTAIMSGGIIYAFNGFQSVASFCSEAKNPARDIPLALIISVILGLIIYLLLQAAFIGGIPPELLKDGWSHLSFQSPIVELTSLLGLHVISFLLYVDACISPSGTGIVYTGATCRMLTAMSQEKQAPAYFDSLHPIYYFSRRSLTFNLFLALSLLWFFPSWESLMVIVSLYHVVSYLACPIAMMRFRITEPDRKRPFKVPYAKIICPVLFVFITLLFCLTPQSSLVSVTLSLVFFYTMYIFISNQGKAAGMLKAFKQSYCLILYFIVLSGLGFLGNPKGGGFQLISNEVFYVFMTLTSLTFYYWLVYGSHGTPENYQVVHATE